MENYKKSNDHLVNSALAAPFILATGNISAAATVLLLGKILDKIENDAFKSRQAEWNKNPYRTIHYTTEEMNKIYKEDIDVSKEISNLPIIKDAPLIYGKCRDGSWISIIGTNGLNKTSQISTRNGSIKFYKDFYTWSLTNEAPAKIYVRAIDFAKSLKKDLQLYDNVKVYRIVMSSCNAKWMYTVNNGKSYVVGL